MMRRALFSVFLLVLITVAPAHLFGAGMIVSGSVSGEWVLADSPVHVVGDIFILPDKSLSIQPGVEIDFEEGVILTVHGSLDMRGTDYLPIILQAAVENTLWGGILIENSTSSAGVMQYVRILDAISGVRLDNSTFNIMDTEVYINWVPDNASCGAFHVFNGSNLTLIRSKGWVTDTRIPWAYVFRATNSFVSVQNCEFSLVITDPIGTSLGRAVFLEQISGEMTNTTIHAESRNGEESNQLSPVIGLYGDHLEGFDFDRIGVRIRTGSPTPSSGVQIHHTADLVLDHFSVDLVPTRGQTILLGVEVVEESEVQINNSIVSNSFDELADNCYSGYVSQLSSRLSWRYSNLFNVTNRADTLIYYEFGTILSSDPLWANENFYLSAGSPCINAGDPSETDPDGSRTDIGMHFFHLTSVGEDMVVSPERFRISGVYPNPFNSSTVISLEVAQSGIVNVSVYDLLGREVAAVASGFCTSGSHQYSWDGRSAGDALPSGMYFIVVKSGAVSAVQRVALIR